MAKRKKLKAAKTEKQPDTKVHERIAHDLPLNASVVPVEVDSAYDIRIGAQRDSRGEWVVPAPARDQVVASLRGDALRDMFVRRSIDIHQYDAGRDYQTDFDMALIGGARAIDFTREAVDGGQLAEPLTEYTRRALQKLAKVRDGLGEEGEAIVRGILGEGLSITEYAARQGNPLRSHREYVGRRLRECLEGLAYFYGKTTVKPRATTSSGGSFFVHARA